MEFEFGNKNFCPKIDVSYMAQLKMDMYVEIAQKEVGWYGLVERTGESAFYIHDVYMIEQEVNAATTEIDPMGLAKLKSTLWKSGVINADNQSKVGLYLWGHSHVNMGTGPSGQDNDQLESIISTSNPPFFIQLIQNKKGEKNIVLFINNIPMLQSMTIKQPIWSPEPNPAVADLKTQLKTEMTEKVKDKVVYKDLTYSSYYNSRGYSKPYGSTDILYDDPYGDCGIGITTAEDGVPEITGVKTIGKVTRKTAPTNSYKKSAGHSHKAATEVKKASTKSKPQVRSLPPQVRSLPPQVRELPPQVRELPPQVRELPSQVSGLFPVLSQAHKTTEEIIAKYSQQADFPNANKDDLGIPDKVV